eukprot:9171554-Alexandrium_andersonii.AAC.1
MSASLVGSEMCIRDSCGGAAGEVLGSVGSVPVVFGSVDRFCSINIPSVSYTHLTLPTICSV